MEKFVRQFYCRFYKNFIQQIFFEITFNPVEIIYNPIEIVFNPIEIFVDPIHHPDWFNIRTTWFYYKFETTIIFWGVP